MRINKRVFQSVNTSPQDSTSRSYPEASIVLRESIRSLTIRLFVIEVLMGIAGILLRAPIIWLALQVYPSSNLIVLYGIVYILFQVVNVITIILVILDWYNRTYTLQSHDIIFRAGVFKSLRKNYQYDNIEKVTLEQGLIGKMLNFGSVVIYNPLIKEDAYIRNIPDPEYYTNIIQGVVPKSADQRIIPKGG